MTSIVNWHKEIENDQIHYPKDFSLATKGDVFWKDGFNEVEYLQIPVLPAVLDLVTASSAPPTEVHGARYILIDTTAVNAAWDGASKNDWVEYDSSSDVWVSITPEDGAMCFDKDTDALQKYDGSTWSSASGGGTITLSGDVSGSGTSSISVTIGAGKVTNSMLAGSIDLTTKVTNVLPIANGGTNLSSLGSALQILRVNAGGTALEYATVSTSNLGNDNLVADNAVRTYTLYGSADTDYLGILTGGASNIARFRGDGKILFGTTTNVSNAEYIFGDSTNTKRITIYGATDNALNIYNSTYLYMQMGGAYTRFIKQSGTGAGSDIDMRFSTTGNAPRILQNTTDISDWQVGYALQYTGNNVLRLMVANGASGGQLEINDGSGNGSVLLTANSTDGSIIKRKLQIGYYDYADASSTLTVTGQGTSTNGAVIYKNSSLTILNKWLDNGRYVQNLASSVISDSDLVNNSTNLYTDGSLVKARYKNNSGTSSDLKFESHEWSSFTFAEGGTLAYQIINPVDHDSYTNAMGFVVPEACTLDEVSVVLGSSSAGASETLTFTVRKLAVGTGLTGSNSAYSLGAGTSVTTVDFVSGGALASKYYRNQASTNLGISLSAGDVLFVESSNFAFWTVADVIVKIKVKC